VGGGAPDGHEKNYFVIPKNKSQSHISVKGELDGGLWLVV